VALLDKLDRIVTDLGFPAYTERKDSTLNIFLLTLSLDDRHGRPAARSFIRFFTVPKVSDARASAGWALVFHRHPLHHGAAVARWRAST